MVLILGGLFVASRPAAYRIERKREIGVTPDRVHPFLHDVQRFAALLELFGEPLEKANPPPKTTVTGPAGAGQLYVWKGDDSAGSLKITESVINQKVTYALAFVEPMTSAATWTLSITSVQKGSTVTWVTEGNHNFLGKVFGLFADMDQMLGADLEKTLANLQAVAEASPPSR